MAATIREGTIAASSALYNILVRIVSLALIKPAAALDT
jgi:hypothetical protein